MKEDSDYKNRFFELVEKIEKGIKLEDWEEDELSELEDEYDWDRYDYDIDM